ncbi:class I SAM-dependent methyltransferase [Aliivibrio fischeri]|uniref:class I SAM-dependent methyltransferase n=1 Tax=Aliivibrio fischeri TaxID=668 RepID=UPI0012D930D6|nr:class I SAM-dependent methyltransferase [Aliivibrio fischeri]MUK26878.1 methyltransferase domain-containing protein [Aliivibrio fischeri]MUK32724.1 methyltransferase domain-containing protein [Aliivibrio fischeri]
MDVLQGKITAEHSLERIYPKQLEQDSQKHQDVLDIHIERYQFASDQLQGMYILDIACGCGYGTAMMAEVHPDKLFVGVDVDPLAIEYAKEHYQADNLYFECGDGMDFQLAIYDGLYQRFDTIISLETIEHVPEPQKMVTHLLTQLSDNGIMIASVPTTPTVDGNPHHLHDFTVDSFYQLFAASNYQAYETFEQIQYWEFKGLFSKKESKENRSQGVGRNIVKHYIQKPSALFYRMHSIITKGLNNRYLTAVFSK